MILHNSALTTIWRDTRWFLRITILTIFLTSCGLASENDLRTQFNQNRTTLDRLLAMQMQDSKVVRIAPSFTRLEDDWSWPRKDIGFTESRWDEYRQLFSKASITDGIQKDGNFVWYFVSAVGLSISGASRGFVYTTSIPKNIVITLENCPEKKGICYVKLDNNWYLFHWVT